MNKTKQIAISARSEIGSRILPNADSWLNLRAIQPSKKSVKPKMAAKIAPTKGLSNVINTRGTKNTRRAIVIMFGIVKILSRFCTNRNLVSHVLLASHS